MQFPLTVIQNSISDTFTILKFIDPGNGISLSWTEVGFAFRLGMFPWTVVICIFLIQRGALVVKSLVVHRTVNIIDHKPLSSG